MSLNNLKNTFQPVIMSNNNCAIKKCIFIIDIGATEGKSVTDPIFQRICGTLNRLPTEQEA